MYKYEKSMSGNVSEIQNIFFLNIFLKKEFRSKACKISVLRKNLLLFDVSRDLNHNLRTSSCLHRIYGCTWAGENCTETCSTLGCTSHQSFHGIFSFTLKKEVCILLTKLCDLYPFCTISWIHPLFLIILGQFS